MTPEAVWPEPYLQPNPREDCGYYATAYIARCLGRSDVTAEQVGEIICHIKSLQKKSARAIEDWERRFKAKCAEKNGESVEEPAA